MDDHVERQGTTRQEITELLAAMEEEMKALREDMEKKHLELKDHLLAANEHHNTKQRRSLQERSKAISAALVAYKVIYENLEVGKLDACRKVDVSLMSSRQDSQVYSLRSTRSSSLIVLETFAEYHHTLLHY